MNVNARICSPTGCVRTAGLGARAKTTWESASLSYFVHVMSYLFQITSFSLSFSDCFSRFLSSSLSLSPVPVCHCPFPLSLSLSLSLTLSNVSVLVPTPPSISLLSQEITYISRLSQLLAPFSVPLRPSGILTDVHGWRMVPKVGVAKT